jgi:hypothetical protein
MSALSDLQVALKRVNVRPLNGLSVDTKLLDQETQKLRAWLGDRGTTRPPRDAVMAALQAFVRDKHISSFRQAFLICFGCTDPALVGSLRLIEDEVRFPKLLSAIDTYLPNPRAFRRCYRGLLGAYFGYDYKHETAQTAGKRNWEVLRTYLNERIQNTITHGVLPSWVDVLQANMHLLGNDPAGPYGESLLLGRFDEYECARKALAIPETSWLTWQIVLAQVETARRKDDHVFQEHLSNLLELLAKHVLAINDGLRALLSRYYTISARGQHPGLRDFAVLHWGNPLLSLNRPKWKVSDDVRKMVAGWLNLKRIQQFFSLLAEDGTADTRRLKFWERYHESIDEVYFALGNSARSHQGRDFREIRREMEQDGQLLELHNAQGPDNAFIMCIGRFVVVERGIKPNACFIFRRDQIPFALGGDIAGDRTGLKHPTHIKRLTHTDGGFERWEDKFEGALASLMQVEPQTQVANDVRMASQEARPLLSNEARNFSPPSSIASFSDRELARLCDKYRLRTKDLRGQHGNLWVLTGDRDTNVSPQLRSWGFSYKAGKGWWRK